MWNPLRRFASAAESAPDSITNEGESYSVSDDAVLQAFYGALSRLTSSGVRVTQENGIRCVAVLACLIVRAQTFSALPIRVKRGPDNEAEDLPDHPAYRLLSIAPNDLMTAKELWRWKQIREDLTGNAFVRIEWRGFTPTALYPLYGANPELVLGGPQPYYRYTGDDITNGAALTPPGPILPRNLLHFKGAVLRSPFKGASLIDLASEAIGVSIGSEQFFARLLGNGSHFPGYLETDAVLKPEDLKAIAEQLKGYAGLFNAGEIRIFDRGLKYQQNDMNMRDAQLVEQMRWQLQQICSVFRVPMAAVQDLTHGTYDNTEQQDVALSKHTVSPICVDSEAVLRARLFTAEPEVYAKFNLDGLQRGDYKTRTDGDATLVRAGILMRNEARGHYDLKRIPGLDVPLAELNLGRVSEDGTVTGPDKGSDSGAVDAASAPPAGGAKAAAILEPMRADAAASIRRRAKADADRGKSSMETIAFAAVKLEPLAAAHAAAGLDFDRYNFICEALADAGDGSRTMDDIGQPAARGSA